MTKGQNDISGGGNHFLAGYGWQVLAAPLLVAVLLFVFFWFFGFDTNLIWTNVFVLAVWLILVLFAFRHRPHGEVWRDYRWIIAPAVVILLFLFDTSWAQSMISIMSVEKSVIRATPSDTFQILAEYPPQIPFDSVTPSELHLWAIGSVKCMDLEISADGLLFAVKPSSDAPVEWDENLTIKINEKATAVTILLQPSNPPETVAQIVQLNLSSGSESLGTQGWKITIESKHDSQIRDWKKNFLNTGGTVVSLITAVFVGVKQLEEEKKRQKADHIKQALTTFDAVAKSDFSKMLEDHLALTTNWNEWDKALQDQSRDKYSSLVKKDLWNILAGLTDMTSIVERLSQLCERIFENKKANALVTIKQLLSALRQDEHAPLALLTMLKEYPASIDVAKQIAIVFPPDIKKKTVGEYASRFPDQIRDLRVEMDFPDLENFPLQGQFAFYAKAHTPENRLTAWLKVHELDFSPFADADSPFYSVLDSQLLAYLSPPGFAFPTPELQNPTLEFANSWDAGAGLFSYCQALRGGFRIGEREETLFVIVTPSLIENHEADHSRKLYLHALAEQWTWSLAEIPTLFYSLKDQQRDLVGRLIRWHDFFPSVTTYKIAQFVGRLQEEEKKDQAALLSKITEWLDDKDATDLRTEEVNTLIELRPTPKQKTLFLISTIDLNPRMESQISPELHRKFSEQRGWLSAHNCGAVHFSMGAKSRQTVSPTSLVNQCKVRVQRCSNNKLEFNQLFDAPGEEPDAILAQKASGSPGKMVRLGQKLLLRHAAKSSPRDYLRIDDLIAI